MAERDRVRLVRTRVGQLAELRSWFEDSEAARRWGGPGLRFPMTEASFRQDLQWGVIPSWSLVARGVLLGFGQYYLRNGRCHLARLVVAPGQRSRGLGRRLVEELLRTGMTELGVSESSLFVMQDNEPAIRCYRSLGFEPRDLPPGEEAMPGVDFMVRPAGPPAERDPGPRAMG